MLKDCYSLIKRHIKRFACGVTPAIKRCFGDRGYFFFLAAVVGLLAGGGAALLKYLIGHLTTLLTGHECAVDQPYYWLLAIPLGGIVLTGIFCRYVLKMPLEHGVERVNHNLKEGKYRLSSRLTFGPILASTITLGMGGSAGSEGPIAYTGAAIGSNMARTFGLTSEQMRILVGVGAGAGIAGIFKAPVGGMLFTLEVMGLSMTTVSVIALVIGCLVAGGTAYALSGFTMDVGLHHAEFFEPSLLLPLIGLGVFCGFYSLWYTACMTRSQHVIERVRNPWVRNLLAGAFIAVLVFLFPTLYGEGYGTVGRLINSDSSHLLDHSLFYGGDVWVVMGVVAAILLVKALAVQTTNSGGGVAGDFAPTLFAGALAGFLFATFVNTVWASRLPVADFAYFGMAAVMAGTIQAPLMALFLTSEMTGDFAMFLPLMIVAAISYGMVRICSNRWRYIFRPVWRHYLRRL